MGAGLDMIPGDIAFKVNFLFLYTISNLSNESSQSNFAYFDKESGIVALRKADRNFEGLGPILCEAIDNV
jgi:hypothetical protein